MCTGEEGWSDEGDEGLLLLLLLELLVASCHRLRHLVNKIKLPFVLVKPPYPPSLTPDVNAPPASHRVISIPDIQPHN